MSPVDRFWCAVYFALAGDTERMGRGLSIPGAEAVPRGSLIMGLWVSAPRTGDLTSAIGNQDVSA